MNCKNCNATVDGNFCSICGQSTKVDTINFRYFINQINSTFLQIEYGLLFTIKQLFIAPGKSIRDFLQGKRKNYFKPIAFVLLLSTIYAVLANYFDETTFIGDVFTGWNKAYKESNTRKDKEIRFLSWFVNNYAYTMLLLLPIFSFASYISFKKVNFNYFEHLVLNSFITGQQAIIYTLFIPFKYISGHNNFSEIVYIAFVFVYPIWVFVQFFNSYKKWKVIFLTLLTYFYYLVFSTILFLILLAINNSII
ncbi:DUF3667 domain-containing protein [Tenacibaculum amylolyticum]|uniref:DUF3667 domain-containing protein n=1 Tax=Tenacibaculum amylolyticum TaxID=104269 RepID=UPI003893FF29